MVYRQCFAGYCQSFSRVTLLIFLLICVNISKHKWGVTGELTFNDTMYKPIKVDKDSPGTGVDWIHSGDASPPSPPPSPPQLFITNNNYQPGQNPQQDHRLPHNNANPIHSAGTQYHGNGPPYNANPIHTPYNPNLQHGNRHHHHNANPQHGAETHNANSNHQHKNVHEVVVEDSLRLRPSFEFNGGDKFAWDDKEFQKQKELSEKMHAMGISKGNENHVFGGGVGGGGNIATHIKREEISNANRQPPHGAIQHHQAWNDPTLQERPPDYYKGKINPHPNTAFLSETYGYEAPINDKKKSHQQLPDEKKQRSHRFDDPPAEIQYKEKWVNAVIDDYDESTRCSLHHHKPIASILLIMLPMLIQATTL